MGSPLCTRLRRALLVLALASEPSPGHTVDLVEFEILPAAPTETDDVSIRVFGLWPDSCIPMEPMASISDGEILIATVSFGELCLTVVTAWSETVPIGLLAAGDYEVVVTNALVPGPPLEIGGTVFTVPEPASRLLGLVALAAAGGMAPRRRRVVRERARRRHAPRARTPAPLRTPA